MQLTADQAVIAGALREPPYRVKVNAGHNVGKTFLAAVLANWWYDSFDPGIVITTAPTERDVVDLLWTEIRLQRQRAGLVSPFIGPRAPELRSSPEHYAKGYTARRGESFQGRHRQRMLFLFDEAEGIDPLYWTTAKSMFRPGAGDAWLVIGNPTTTTSQSYLEESATDTDGNPSWRLFALSALHHPNLAAALAGDPLPVPLAVTLTQVDQWVGDWCEPVPPGEQQVTDIEWRPGSGTWYRPGPIAEARILGRRPSAGTFGVWSDALWAAAERTFLSPTIDEYPQIGCDVARFGDDWTCLHVRWGPASFHHEAHNGWDTQRTAARLEELAGYWAHQASDRLPPGARALAPGELLLKVDDDGVGGGVTDACRARGLTVIAVGAGARAVREDRYPNRRSELWFDLADRARHGRLSLCRLPWPVLARLRQQALAPEWEPDGQGRRRVEGKDVTKEKLGRSPDDLDAVHLAFHESGAGALPGIVNVPAVPYASRRYRERRRLA